MRSFLPPVRLITFQELSLLLFRAVCHTAQRVVGEVVAVTAGATCLGHQTSRIPRAAALLVLIAALENADDPKSLADNVKRYAFTRCGEMNVYGIVDAQIAALENQLLTHNSPLS